MKPEISTSAILKDKPSRTRLKRLTRFVTELIRLAPKSADGMEEERLERLAKAKRLEKLSQCFLNDLRGNFGKEALQEGLVLYPRNDNHHTLTVSARAEDTDHFHQTLADICIISGANHVTQLAMGTIEPTVGAKRRGATVAKDTWLQVVDPTNPMLSYSFTDFNRAEQDQLVDVTDQALKEVVMACDSGEFSAYAQVH